MEDNTITKPEEAQTSEEKTTSENKDKVSTETATTDETRKRAPREGGQGPRPRRLQGKRRRSSKREDRRPEFDSKIISIRRVTRVVAGGRRFSFSVALVAGDKKGRVGVGIGKGSDTELAIEKAMRDAKKHMIRVPLSKEKQLSHEVQAKYCASSVVLVPAPGRGVGAGGSVRTVLELAGVQDVTGKILSRSKNQLNNARATIKAFQSLLI